MNLGWICKEVSPNLCKELILILVTSTNTIKNSNLFISLACVMVSYLLLPDIAAEIAADLQHNAEFN